MHSGATACLGARVLARRVAVGREDEHLGRAAREREPLVCHLAWEHNTRESAPCAALSHARASSPCSCRLAMRFRKRFFMPLVWLKGEGWQTLKREQSGSGGPKHERERTRGAYRSQRRTSTKTAMRRRGSWGTSGSSEAALGEGIPTNGVDAASLPARHMRSAPRRRGTALTGDRRRRAATGLGASGSEHSAPLAKARGTGMQTARCAATDGSDMAATRQRRRCSYLRSIRGFVLRSSFVFVWAWGRSPSLSTSPCAA